jgi:hypothetical protein
MPVASLIPASNVYVDEPWLLMRWDSVRQYVHSEWLAFASSAEVRTSVLKGIQAIRVNKAVAYVTDARKVKVIVHADQKWLKETWMPLAIQAGLKRIAFVTAASGLGKLTTEDVARSYNCDQLQSQIFDSMEAAQAWVSQAHGGLPYGQRIVSDRRVSVGRRWTQSERRISQRRTHET